jgi:HlyD family secretion protein
MSRAAIGLDDLPALKADIERISGASAERRLIRNGVGLILGLALVLVAWATVAQLGAAVMASGVVMGNHQVVQHPDGGVVSEILVQEGQLVQKGQPLLRLDPLQVRAVLDTQSEAVDTFTAVVARLEAEQAGAPAIVYPASLMQRAADPAVAQILRTQESLFRARRSDMAGAGGPLADQAAQAMNMAHGLEGQIRALDQQDALVQSQLSSMRALAARGYAPQARVMSVEQAAASIAGQRQQYESQIAAYHNSAEQARAQAGQVRRSRLADVSTQLAEARANLDAAAERRKAAQDVLDRTVVRAPAAGHVLGLGVHTVGAVLGRGERILEIVPVDAKPVVDVHIAPGQGEAVKAGMKAQLLLLSSGGRRLPRIQGVVTRRSSDLLADPKTGQPYYDVEVAVDPASLKAIPGLKLIPGTPMEVVLPTKSRSALQYMLEPMADSFRHGLREP